MADVMISLDKVDMARLSRAIIGLRTNTGRNCFQSVMFASVRCAESLRAASKPAKYNRPIVKNPGNTTRGRKKIPLHEWLQSGIGYDYIIKFGKWYKRTQWFTNDPNDPLRIVHKAGLAKRMWNIIAAKAASNTTKTFSSGNLKYNEEHAAFNVFTGMSFTSAKLESRLQYLLSAYGPAYVAKGVNTAVKKLEYDAHINAAKDCAEATRG